MVGHALSVQCGICLVNYENGLRREENGKQRGYTWNAARGRCGE